MGSKLAKGILFFYPYIPNVLILAESRKKRKRKEGILIQPNRKIDFLQNWSETLGPIK